MKARRALEKAYCFIGVFKMFFNRVSYPDLNQLRLSLLNRIRYYKKQYVKGLITDEYFTDRIDVFSYLIYLLDTGKIKTVKKGSIIDEKI